MISNDEKRNLFLSFICYNFKPLISVETKKIFGHGLHFHIYKKMWFWLNNRYNLFLKLIFIKKYKNICIQIFSRDHTLLNLCSIGKIQGISVVGLKTLKDTRAHYNTKIFAYETKVAIYLFRQKFRVIYFNLRAISGNNSM